VAQNLGVVLVRIKPCRAATEELLFGEELLMDLHAAFEAEFFDVFTHGGARDRPNSAQRQEKAKTVKTAQPFAKTPEKR